MYEGIVLSLHCPSPAPPHLLLVHSRITLGHQRGREQRRRQEEARCEEATQGIKRF